MTLVSCTIAVGLLGVMYWIGYAMGERAEQRYVTSVGGPLDRAVKQAMEAGKTIGATHRLLGDLSDLAAKQPPVDGDEWKRA